MKISESERKVLTYWLIVAMIILLIVAFIAYRKNKKNEDAKNDIVSEGTNKLLDEDRYYTVQNAIIKYYSYINIKDYDSVLTILNEDYKKDNGIDEDNIKEYVTFRDEQVTYKSRIMCVEDVKNGIYTYVVEGKETTLNSTTELAKKYYQVVLDGNTTTYSIKPIEQKEYEGVCSE